MSLTFLSKTMDPLDLAGLELEVKYVDHHLDPHQAEKRWAYALALQAVGRWIATGRQLSDAPLYEIVYDASKFHYMLDDWTERDTIVFAAMTPFCTAGTPLTNLIVAHSVIEHVADPDRFLYHCSCLLAPGGLLVLTMAYWNHCGPDVAHGRETRQRIYCPKLMTELRRVAATYHLTTFGGVDPMWHGAQIHDHSLASLVLEKYR
jgi:SAM-dependent methyltransferase